MERLAKNIGGYRGETIDVAALLRNVQEAAAGKNWIRDTVHLAADRSPIPIDFIAYRRIVEAPRVRLYISTGIHGDEPAGPLAALRLLQLDEWPADFSVWLVPCLNPTGFLFNRRENYQGIDLNRDYRTFVSEEIRVHEDWLKQQPNFDLSICLHEDWESLGFYVYETNPNDLPSLAEKIIDAVAKVCPIEKASLVDDWEAVNGVIRPKIVPAERQNWPEALYLIVNKSRIGYTLEAPSDFPLAGRVNALVEGVRAVLKAL